MDGMTIQNILIFATLIATIFFASRAQQQSTRVLNVDINFRALDRRKALFQKLQSELRFFTHELSSDGNYYPELSVSEEYDRISLYEEENFSSVDYFDLLRENEKIDLLLVEASLIFPSAKNEFYAIRKHIPTIINLTNATSSSEAKENAIIFKQLQRKCDKTAKQAFHKMEKYMDISQFGKLNYY
ncbi:MAG: hypothetical protein KF820_06005 [Candidatus Paracaedibacteraceae bacterium]|nr:hypothetical protein [Candidatus Paracaedibacteraceae bacterium]